MSWSFGLMMMGCAMDGGSGMVIDHAWWRTPGVLRVALWTEARGPFALEDATGSRRGDAACVGERCLLTFEGAESPERVRLAGTGASVPLLACGEDPFGLCPFGLTCVEHTCVPLCAPSHPDGACLDDGARCVRGGCAFEAPPT